MTDNNTQTDNVTTFEVKYSFYCEKAKQKRTNLSYFGDKPFVFEAAGFCSWAAFCAIREELEKTPEGRDKLEGGVDVEAYKIAGAELYTHLPAADYAPEGFYE